ncbi:hypothetical protein JCM11641_005271 [Rhodosporidiobolus odoratus]
MTPPTPISLSALLASHENDPHVALASLVSSYNKLVQSYSTLEQDKIAADRAAERAAVENQQLWRSLKSGTGARGGGASPRPGGATALGLAGTRKDSVGLEASSGGKGLGIEGSLGGLGTSRTLRRGYSGDSVERLPHTSSSSTLHVNGRPSTGASYTSKGSGHDFLPYPPAVPSSHPHSSASSPRFAAPTPPADLSDRFFDPPSASSATPPQPATSPSPSFPSHHFSHNALRAKAATPPPSHGSPRARGDGLDSASNMRKTSSLDLSRGIAAGEERSPHRSNLPQTPPSAASSSLSHSNAAAQRRPSSPTPVSAHLSAQAQARMSNSSSMPLLAAGLPDASSRFLPSITPVSPLFSGSTTGDSTTSTSNSGKALQAQQATLRDRDKELTFPSTSHGQDALAPLQPPNGYTRRERERERTVSGTGSGSGSASSGLGLGSAFLLDPSSGVGGAGGGMSTSKADRRRSMFLPPTGSSRGAAEFGGAGGGTMGGMGLPSSASTNLLNLAALAESREGGEGSRARERGMDGGKERRPSRTHTQMQAIPPYLQSQQQSTHSNADSTSSSSILSPTSPSSASASASSSSTRPTQPPPPPRPNLTPSMLASTKVRVAGSNIRVNEKHKEIVSFIITFTCPYPSSSTSSTSSTSSSSPQSTAEWKIEKLYSDVLALDAAVKSKPNRGEKSAMQAMASLPDKSLFKDHAPQRGDLRKAVLEKYLQTLLTIPLRDKSPVCSFLNSDILPPSPSTTAPAPTAAPVTPTEGPGAGPGSGSGLLGQGPMEGWLTKRGRNFGGWQTRFYVLEPGRALGYFDAPGGTKLGEISLERAAIGRQSSSTSAPSSSAIPSSSSFGRPSKEGEGGGDDNAYLHAFLIRTRDDKDQEADHILCAENDEMRDRWVGALTTLQPARGGSQIKSPSQSQSQSQNPAPPTLVPPSPKEGESASTSAGPGPLRGADRRRSGSGPPTSGTGGLAPALEGGELGEQNRSLLSPASRSAGNDLPPSVSLPSDLHALAKGLEGRSGSKGATSMSDTGHSSSTAISTDPSTHSSASGGSGSGSSASRTTTSNRLQAPPSRRPSAQTGHAASTATDRPVSPHRLCFESAGGMNQTQALPPQTRYQASDVSGPMNAVPLPSGYEFKKQERQKKTKSSFWGFARGSSDKGSSSSNSAPAPPARPVFGVPLKEAVSISRVRPGLELPAIVYRCVEYLEAKNAEHEEGIFRLSGSANVIRLLKDRFNAEGDVNLLQSNEYYDPHAIAGVLKQYLRELPVHLLTRELHGEFLRVIDLRNRRDRVNALGKLVARLPIEEYTLFRFFFAHLCLIAQNAETSKMNLRNLGIVFSPTLAIPAPLFSLLLAEFDLVFAVEKETGTAQPIMVEDDPVESPVPTSPVGERRAAHRNSLLYQASGADKLMEGELTKLRENDEDSISSTSEEPTTSTLANGDSANLTEDGPPSSTYLSTTSSVSSPGAPSRPRSPGLPTSPRPGGGFGLGYA